MKENKTITLDDAFELTEDFQVEKALERFTSEVMEGGYDDYIETVEDLKKAITNGVEMSWIEEQAWKVRDYCLDKINGEVWEVVADWLSSEGYEMNDDGETYS